MDSNLYALKESLNHEPYLLATYYLETDAGCDIMKKAESFAVGQTIGTWLPVPGISEQMRKCHCGKVVNVLEAPPADLDGQTDADRRTYLITIGFPVANFGGSLPMMLTTLLGNDASTSAQVKLVDIQFPQVFLDQMPGPAHGIDGLRRIAGLSESDDRPLLLNMIKPCTGFAPEEGAAIFLETARGGVDFIKDDELLGNPAFCPVVERVKAYNEAARQAFLDTGHQVTYIANITDSAGRILENAQRVEEAGAKVLMLSFAAVGYSVLQMLRERVSLPILGHYASSGMFYEGVNSGMSSHFAIGRLPRLAGADAVMINTPYGNYPIKRLKYLQTALQLTLPSGSMKPAMPIAGGGVHPGLVPTLVNDLGPRIMIAAGGAIQGHPMGAAAGARAMRQAIDATMSGIALTAAAESHVELKTAISLWK